MVLFALDASKRSEGVYFTLNPIRPDWTKNASAEGIERRRLLLIDSDPVRDGEAKKAAGDGAKLSATDSEKAHGTRMAGDIRDFLATLGWPAPVEADSGNGGHLLYAISQPNTAKAKDLIRLVLKALAHRFNTADAEVDTVVFDAPRVTKFYGTVARKGKATTDRPHRASRILAIPEGFGDQVVTHDQLAAVAEMGKEAEPAEEPPTRPNPFLLRSTSGSDRWTPEARAWKYLESVEPAVSGQKGHNQTLKASCKAGPGFDLAPEATVRLLMEWNKGCQPEWTEKDIRRKVDEAYKVETRRGWLRDAPRKDQKAGPKADASKGQGGPPPVEASTGGDPPERPDVEINTERHLVVEETIRALRADPDLYRRGPYLASVVQDVDDELKLTEKTAIKHLSGTPRIINLSDAVIGCHLTRNAKFFQWRTPPKGEPYAAPAHPPDWLIKAVATRNHWPGIRRLQAVVECPFPRPDGSIVETPGYDKPTATLYIPTIDFPKLADRPTRDDARAAWGRFRHLIRQFPFPTEDDRVVALAGALTAIGRVAIAGPVPGFAVIGNKASTGKGLLIDCMVMPSIGRRAPTSSYPSDKAEAEKVKVSIALAGMLVVHFDNLDEGTMYGGSAIDSALTTTTIQDRVLGSSDRPELPLRPAWFLSGNNVVPCKDAYRRWAVCNLVTDLEYPERRSDIDKTDLRAHMVENRGEIVRDLLTILKAHALADRPGAGWSPLGSFEEWDWVIRRAVWFATDRDCLATQQKTAEESPDRLAKIALLEGWRELPGGKAGEGGVTAGEACDLAEKNPERFQGLRAVLSARGRGGKLATSGVIGNALRGLKNTRIGGFRLKENGKHHGAVSWVVEKIAGETSSSVGESGESGECDLNTHGRDCNSNHNVITNGVNGKTCTVRLGPHSPDSPDSPTEISRIRAIVATWSEGWREEFGQLANRLHDAGSAWPADEIEAFAQVLARVASIESQPTSPHD